jgi:hypothetical protein
MRTRKLMEQFPADKRIDVICTDCIGDEILKGFFSGSDPEPCSLCNQSGRATTTGQLLANTSRSIIRDHFEVVQKVDDDTAPLTLSQVLKEVTGIENDNFCQMMANHIVHHPRAAENGFFDLDNLYLNVHTRFVPTEDKWGSIALDLIHRQRYFNKKAEKFFEILLDEAIQAQTKTLFGNLPAAVKIISAGRTLYRARKSDSSVEKDIHNDAIKALGAPPKKFAAHNRMNPAGISLFYGAESEVTAIAEIRPSIGDKVAVGKFKTTRELKFFDFRGFNNFPLRKKVSHWYDFYKDRIESRRFLSHLHKSISQPVLNGDNGYIITQAFTEYLLNHQEQRFDGLIFNSVQDNSGVNYVVFPEKLESSNFIYENWEPEFPVSLNAPPIFHTIKAIEYKWS